MLGGRGKSISGTIGASRRHNRNLQMKRKRKLIDKISDVNNINAQQYTIFMHSMNNGFKYHNCYYEKFKTFKTFEDAEIGLIELIKNNMVKRYKKYIGSDDECRPGRYVNVRFSTYDDNKFCYIGMVTNNSIDHSLLTGDIIHTLKNGVIMWKLKYDDFDYRKKYSKIRDNFFNRKWSESRKKKKKEKEAETEKLKKTYRKCKFKMCEYHKIHEDISDLKAFFKNKLYLKIDKNKHKYRYSNESIRLLNRYIEKFNSSYEYSDDSSTSYDYLSET
jgi:hypothetical protein